YSLFIMNKPKAKKSGKFSAADLAVLKKHGIAPAQAELQLRRFKKGFPFVELVKPCTLQDGVLKLTAKEEKEAEKLFRQAVQYQKTVKFVPASGAASRMFSFLQENKPEF